MTPNQWSYAATKARHRLQAEKEHISMFLSRDALKLIQWIYIYEKGCREEALYLKLMGRR